MLDIPHGGIVCSNSPVECFLKYQDASSPKAAHIPVSRLFFLDTQSLRILNCSSHLPAYFDKSLDMIYKIR